jgi:hypothetical protein
MVAASQLDKTVEMRLAQGEVLFVPPDTTLKKKIGVPLQAIFTKEKVQAAQKVMDGALPEFLDDCIRQLTPLRQMLSSGQPEAISFLNLQSMALNISQSAMLAHYPLASQLALMLHEAATRPALYSEIGVQLMRTMADALNAAFIERRRGANDSLGNRVLRELQEKLDLLSNRWS